MHFETILVEIGRMPLWKWHLERLSHTAAILGYDLLCDCESTLNKYIKDNNIFEGVVRLEINPYAANPITISDRALPFANPHTLPIFTQSKSTALHSSLKLSERSFYNAAATFAAANGYGDAIIVNKQLQICETTIGNIWVLEQGVLNTPSLASGCIAGVQRARLLAEGNALGYPTQEKDFAMASINGKQLFVSNAVRAIYPIKIADQ